MEFTVKNSNNTACIMANLSANFSVTYETTSGPKVGSATGALLLCVRGVSVCVCECDTVGPVRPE